jgi:3-carboxy-cis,cis-muconate cycloisomerase
MARRSSSIRDRAMSKRPTMLGGLLSDAEVAALVSDAAAVRQMLAVEVALARVQGRLGIIPQCASDDIAAAAATFEPDFAALSDGTERSGVPVIDLVEQLRAAVGGEAANFVHWGATSQDIVDTAMVLQMRGVLDVLAVRLDAVCARLADLAGTHRATPMAARTRFQQALPTTFGLKVAGWRAPLRRHATRLAELRPRFEVVQFGGAAGTLAALGPRGIEVMEALAAELGLAAPPLPWHTQRDGIAEVADWFALVSGALGKAGLDAALMAQTEVGEVRLGPDGAGGSSTLPQKANPVVAEVLMSLARMNATLLSGVHQAQLQAHERDGSGWHLEWMTLPQMAIACAAALRHAATMFAHIAPDTARMRANLDTSNGVILAEAAVFALASHMPRDEAQALVTAACQEVSASGRPLGPVLADRTALPIDWPSVLDPENYLGAADALITRALSAK